MTQICEEWAEKEKVNLTIDYLEYLAKPHGRWLVVPGIRGTLLLTANSRIDLLKSHAGIRHSGHVSQQPTKLADAWTWDNLLIAAEACHKAGNPFGLPLGVTTDAVDWLGALFHAFGAELVDSNGNIRGCGAGRVALGALGLAHADKLRAWRSSLVVRAFQEMGVAATRAIARARSCTKFSLVAAGKSRRFVLNTGAL